MDFIEKEIFRPMNLINSETVKMIFLNDIFSKKY